MAGPVGPFAPRPPLDQGPFDCLIRQAPEALPAVPVDPTWPIEKPLIITVPALARSAGPWVIKQPPQFGSPNVPPQQTPVELQPSVPTRPALSIGPFVRLNRTIEVTPTTVRATQVGVEVINSGNPASIQVRVTQVGVEAINSGNPTNLKVRLTQIGVEVISPPPTIGKPKKPPPKPRRGGAAMGNMANFIAFFHPEERIHRLHGGTTGVTAAASYKVRRVYLTR